MVKVKCIQRFNDVTKPVDKMQRFPDETWEVSEERAKHLVAEGMAEIVTEKTTTAKAVENKAVEK